MFSSFRIIYLRLFIFSAFVLCLLLSAGHLHAAGLKGQIKIGGTGFALGSFKELAEEFNKIHPDVHIIILPSMGSWGGIKAINDGALDIGLSSRPLKGNELQEGMTAVEQSRTPFLFVTAHKHRGLNFTLKDIAAIYSGATKNWPDGTPVRPVLRPESDSDTVVLKSISPEIEMAIRKALSREGMVFATTDQESADAIEHIRGAIGTSSLAQIISENRALNTIALEGVVPDMKNLANGSYKYFKTLYIVTGPKSGPLTRDFIEFINSVKGRGIFEKTGNLPMQR